jgi:tRNA(fMet)-specific endonuclease VapC
VRFLVDTNIISEPFKLQPSSSVVAKLTEYANEIAIASVSWHELLYGFYRLPDSRRKWQLQDFLRQVIQPNVPILPYSDLAAEWIALERARLTALGQPPSYPDGQIAAISKVNGSILVTRNVADYINFIGLSIENWFD